MTGFVGAHVARHLLATGVEVTAVVRPDAHLDRIPDLAERVSLHVDDGSVDTLRAIVDATAPRRHVPPGDATSWPSTRPATSTRSSLTTSRSRPAWSRRSATSSASFVNVGTCWQHVDGAAYRPKNLYASTKQAFEDVLRWYVERGSVRAVTVNLYDSYGPLDHRAKLLGALVDALRTGDTLGMSSGVQLVDLVHVDDIVRGLQLAADLARRRSRTAPWPIHSLSSGRPRTLRELVDVLGEVAGRPVPVEWGARADRRGDMVEHWDAGPPVPGWAPTISLESGLAELLDRRRGAALRPRRTTGSVRRRSTSPRGGAR